MFFVPHFLLISNFDAAPNAAFSTPIKIIISLQLVEQTALKSQLSKGRKDGKKAAPNAKRNKARSDN